MPELLQWAERLASTKHLMTNTNIMNSLLLFLTIFAFNSEASPLFKRDASTLFVDSRGYTCPAPTQGTTYYVQPAIYSNRFVSSTIIDPLLNCKYVTVSRVPVDIVVSTLYTTTVLPNGRTIFPQATTSCSVSTSFTQSSSSILTTSSTSIHNTGKS